MPPPLALAFHGVADVALRQDRHRLFTSVPELRRHVARLRAWGYELLTFSSWARHVRDGRGEGSAALTFDDGFADNLHALAPVLADLGAPATVFVVSGWLGRGHPDAPGARMLTVAELRELHASGVEIGAHTRTHPDLSRLSSAEAELELAGGRADLEDLLAAAVTTFAYPYGAATTETVQLARSAGFAAACRTQGRGRWEDVHDLPRQDMGNRATAPGLWLKRNDLYMPLMGHRSARLLRRARLTAHGAPLRGPTG